MEGTCRPARSRKISLSTEEYAEPAEGGWSPKLAENSKNRDKFFKRKIKNNRECARVWVLVREIPVDPGRIDREVADFEEEMEGWWDMRLIWSNSSDFSGR